MCKLFGLFLLSIAISGGLSAQQNKYNCPDGTKATIQLKDILAANLPLNNAQPVPLAILGAIYLYDRDNGIENYPGISGICESQGPGYQLLEPFFNGFSATPSGQTAFSAFLCCGIPPDPCADGSGTSGGGDEGNCGPNGSKLVSQTISLSLQNVSDCSQAEAYLNQSNLMKEFRPVYLQCQAPGSNRPQLAKTASFLNLIRCAGGGRTNVSVIFEYCCSAMTPQAMKEGRRQ